MGTNTRLDQEWVELLIEAKEGGLTKEDISSFLNDPQHYLLQMKHEKSYIKNT
ncbi:anti-repressor SinI family protein [Bacillus marinisedimentorum]|uniref:anti-repressor SinI family protein n=1 Tax=Bacillus marinisedimentorum TaxID=1821260 RepID=UPI000A61A7B8|nr:anti-repressor SinI family protein [Bacillus marinisedimentorum]